MLWLNSNPVKFEQFPNGECRLVHTEIRGLDYDVWVTWKWESDADLIKLMFLKRYLDSIRPKKRFHVHLEIYYLPYSRMDRSDNFSPFTLKYITEFINSLDFYDVEIIEPHSDVSLALINNSHPWYITIPLLSKVMEEIGFDSERDYVMLPDQGSAKRIGTQLKGVKQLVGIKSRDFRTGQITSLSIHGLPEENNFRCIIVDDLCSYGGTFIKSAEKLKELGASEIYLLVAHCEFSIFKGKIFETNLIDRVFTTNSIIDESCRINEDRLKIYKIEELD